MKMSIEEKSKKARALAQMAEELVEERGDVVLFNLAKDNLVNVSVRGSRSEIAFSMLNPVAKSSKICTRIIRKRQKHSLNIWLTALSLL